MVRKLTIEWDSDRGCFTEEDVEYLKFEGVITQKLPVLGITLYDTKHKDRSTARNYLMGIMLEFAKDNLKDLELITNKLEIGSTYQKKEFYNV